MKSQCPYPAAKEKAEEVSGSWHAGSLHGISPLRLYRLYTKYISMYPNEVTESGSWRFRLDIGCTVVHIGSSLAKVRTKKMRMQINKPRSKRCRDTFERIFSLDRRR